MMTSPRPQTDRSETSNCRWLKEIVDADHPYLRDVLGRVSTHPNSRIAELTPRGWRQQRQADST